MVDYRDYTTIEAWQEALEAAGLECSAMLVHDVKNLGEGWKVEFPQSLELAVQWGFILLPDPHTYLLLRQRKVKFAGDH